MHYVVKVKYDYYEFVDPQEMFDFATVAKKSAINNVNVSIEVVTDEEYAEFYGMKKSED